jgi:hypothetical protein
MPKGFKFVEEVEKASPVAAKVDDLAVGQIRLGNRLDKVTPERTVLLFHRRLTLDVGVPGRVTGLGSASSRLIGVAKDYRHGGANGGSDQRPAFSALSLFAGASVAGVPTT